MTSQPLKQRAVGYVRRPLVGGDGTMHPGFQKKTILNHCAINGLDLYTIFDDEAGDAQGLQFALQAIHAGLAEVLLVCRLDLMPSVDMPPVHIMAISDQRPPGPERDGLKEQIAKVIEGYRNNVAIRRAQAKVNRRQDGVPPYRNRSTFGIKDEREQMILGLIIRWHLEGADRGDIIHRLNSTGLLTKRGCLWTYAQLGAIFLDMPSSASTDQNEKQPACSPKILIY
ncbi:MAG: recombinase family protein [Cyanobacteria bacterium SZAS LIN-3]|nr:recombinase family protein [Cyanobacteria bacterium SZAS LIN-3]